jgi:hypothetical protein
MTDINLNDGIELDESNVNFGDSAMGLADFCNVDVGEIEANEGGFEVLPQGVYEWKCDSIKIGSTTRRNKDTNEEFKVPNIAIQFIIENVVSTNGYDGDESKLIERKHTEFFALPTFDGEQFSKAVGRLKAMAMKMAGRDKDWKYASVQAILNDMINTRFSAKIKHRKYNDRDGNEKIQDEIDSRTIKEL